jgi:hypothetical protein
MAFELRGYIDTHLAYELKYLLVAATTWAAVHHEVDRRPWPDHLVVLAMESAFVHTRVLYEFIGGEEGWGNRSPHSPLRSDLWQEYQGPMHQKVLHPAPTRPYQPTGTTADDLKERVVDFALDVLDLWERVAQQQVMRHHRTSMEDARRNAIRDAERSAQILKISPVFA